jgi:hypothetical protein
MMGMSYADAVRCGIAHEHPDHPGRRKEQSTHVVPPDRPGEPVAAPKGTRMVGLNKTEQRFADMLASSPLVTRWEREPFKFRLAGRTFYTPDFGVWHWNEPRLTLCELKGWMRDDAAVKLKVAASRYPEFRWLLVTRDSRGRVGRWEVREVTSAGIGRDEIEVEWIG